MNWDIERLFQKPKTELVIVSALSAVMLVILLARTGLLTYSHPGYEHPGDWHKYLYMSTHPLGSFHIAPYCWRIGVPQLAGLLPFNPQWNFLLLTCVAVWVTAVLVYYIARSFNFDRTTSLVALAVYFSLGWATKVPLKYFWLVDSMSMMIVTAAILAAVHKKAVWFVVLLAVGVTFKESVIFVAPLYYSLNTDKVINLKFAARCFLFTVPAIGVLAAVRLLIPQLGGDPTYLNSIPENLRVIQQGLSTHYNLAEWAEANGLERLRNFSLANLHDYTIGTFNAGVVILSLFGLKRLLPLLVRFLPFLALVYLQLVFAGNTERLLVMGFPAVILFALCGVQSLCEWLAVSPLYLLFLPLTYFGLYLIDPDNIRMPFESTVVATYIALIFQLAMWRREKQPVS